MEKHILNDILKKHEKWLKGQGGEKANLSNANLIGVSFSNANFSNADLSNANLRHADLSDADLRFADLTDADLTEANLTNANLSDANLSNADLSNANLTDADLSDADLRFADLSNANLIGVNLRFANLSDANLRFALIWSTKGNEKEIKNINSFDLWKITYINSKEKGVIVQIGCERHTLEQWEAFSDDEIDNMDESALEWWHKNKKEIITTIKDNPAALTK